MQHWENYSWILSIYNYSYVGDFLHRSFIFNPGPKHMFKITNVTNCVQLRHTRKLGWVLWSFPHSQIFCCIRHIIHSVIFGQNLLPIPRQSCLPCFLPLNQHQHLSFFSTSVMSLSIASSIQSLRLLFSLFTAILKIWPHNQPSPKHITTWHRNWPRYFLSLYIVGYLLLPKKLYLHLCKQNLKWHIEYMSFTQIFRKKYSNFELEVGYSELFCFFCGTCILLT